MRAVRVVGHGEGGQAKGWLRQRVGRGSGGVGRVAGCCGRQVYTSPMMVPPDSTIHSLRTRGSPPSG